MTDQSTAIDTNTDTQAEPAMSPALQAMIDDLKANVPQLLELKDQMLATMNAMKTKVDAIRAELPNEEQEVRTE